MGAGIAQLAYFPPEQAEDKDMNVSAQMASPRCAIMQLLNERDVVVAVEVKVHKVMTIGYVTCCRKSILLCSLTLSCLAFWLKPAAFV
jgi:hypothetical protein